MFLIAVASIFINKENGQTKKYAGAPGDITSTGCADAGQGCHDVAVAGSSITLTGAPTSYVPGQVYTLTLTVSDPTKVVTGFQIVATNGTTGTQVGTFTAVAGTKIATGTGTVGAGRLIHSVITPMVSGTKSWTFNWAAPTTGAPSNIVFYYSGVAGDGNSDETIGDKSPMGHSGMIPIGVELVSFNTSIQKGNLVQLNWSTASETDNKSFVIERKTEEMPFFEEVSKVKGHGTTSQVQAYTFTDDAAAVGKINYYRLRQEDFDGKVTYSKVLSVALKTSFKVKVYPSVVKNGDILTVEAIGSSDKTVQVDIVNMAGQVVKIEKNTAYTEGVQFPISNLSTGRYIIKVRNSDKQNYASFVVE